MLPFVLYLVGGLLTAFHVYVLLTLAALGVPHNILQLFSLLGSLGLIGSAFISLFRPRLAAQLALIASLGAWCFYAPAIVATIKSGRHQQLPKLPIAALPYAAVVFLVLITIYSAVVSFRKTSDAGSRNWFFPDGTSRSTRVAIGIGSVAVAIGLAAWVSFGAQNSTRPSSRFLIPDGYVGWVRVEFRVGGAPPTPVEHGQYVFRIPADGLLRTSSPEKFGWAKDEYYYDSSSALRRLSTDAAHGRLVWGQINGEQGGPSGPRQQYEEFFVGTEQQFRDFAGARSTGVKKAGSSPAAGATK
jgi:Family of unknown function (DUF6843)